MSLTDDQKQQLNKLMGYRDQIVDDLFQIEQIIKHYFPEEFDLAYQHWIPQIMTALYNDTKWLSRGQASLQDSIDRIKDVSDSRSGVSKFTK